MVKKIKIPSRVGLRSREFAINNKEYAISTKKIRNAKGTLFLKIRIEYYKGKSKKKLIGFTEGQSTTFTDETVSKNINDLTRRAFKDGVISFLEKKGLAYSDRWFAEVQDYYLIYWERGVQVKKELKLNQINNAVPDSIYELTEKEDVTPKVAIGKGELTAKHSLVEVGKLKRIKTEEFTKRRKLYEKIEQRVGKLEDVNKKKDKRRKLTKREKEKRRKDQKRALELVR